MNSFKNEIGKYSEIDCLFRGLFLYMKRKPLRELEDKLTRERSGWTPGDVIVEHGSCGSFLSQEEDSLCPSLQLTYSNAHDRSSWYLNYRIFQNISAVYFKGNIYSNASERNPYIISIHTHKHANIYKFIFTKSDAPETLIY